MLRSHRSRIEQAANEYSNELRRRQPKVMGIERMPGSIAGAQVWFRVKAHPDDVEEALYTIVRLSSEWEELHRVGIIATVAEVDPEVKAA